MSLLGAIIGRLNTVVAGPADVSGYDIYQQMRKHAVGTASLHAAARAAENTNARLAAAEQAMRSYQNAMSAGYRGTSGSAALGSADPVVGGMRNSQDEIAAFGRASQGQADSFDRYARTLIDVPKHKPSFWKRLGGMLNPFDGNNPGNDIDSYHEAVEHNKSQYRAYGGATQQYAGQLPGDQHDSLRTEHNTGQDPAHRQPGKGSNGYDGYDGSDVDNGTLPGAGGGTSDAGAGIGEIPNVHLPGLGGTSAAGFAPAAGAGFGTTGLGVGNVGVGSGSAGGFGAGGAGAGFGLPGTGLGGGNLAGYGARGLAALESAAARSAMAARGGAGGMPVGGRNGKDEKDAEHRFADYLISDNNGNEIVGDVELTAPPVIGE